MLPSIALPTSTLDPVASYATFDHYEGFTQEYKGVPIWKNVDDMERYRRVIEATKPEVIVEAGTRWGGFAVWLADTFGVDVITIDVDTAVEGRPKSWLGVTFLAGSSVKTQVLSQVRQLVGARRTMVTLDSDHHMPHVLREIRAYTRIVTPGQYLVVEDGLAEMVSDTDARRFGHNIPEKGGPLQAIARTLVGDPAWERDLEIEGMSPISYCPAGWWRKR